MQLEVPQMRVRRFKIQMQQMFLLKAPGVFYRKGFFLNGYLTGRQHDKWIRRMVEKQQGFRNHLSTKTIS